MAAEMAGRAAAAAEAAENEMVRDLEDPKSGRWQGASSTQKKQELEKSKIQVRAALRRELEHKIAFKQRRHISHDMLRNLVATNVEANFAEVSAAMAITSSGQTSFAAQSAFSPMRARQAPRTPQS